MASFVVTAGVSSNSTGMNLRERRGDNLGTALTGTTYAPGTVLGSLHQSGPWLAGLHDGTFNLVTQIWHRLGTNRWVNERLGDIRHMRRVSVITPVRQRTVNRAGVARTGPGTFFASTTGPNNGARVSPTHSINVDNLGLSSAGNRGVWVRIGTRRWIHSSRLN